MYRVRNGSDSRDKESGIWSGVASAERPEEQGTRGLLQQAMEDMGETSRLDIKQKTEGPDHSRSKAWKAKRPYGPSAKPVGGLKPTHMVARRIYQKKQENPHTGIDQDKNSNSSSKAGVWRQRQSSSSD